MAKTRLCNIYSNMKDRCYNPKSKCYKNYGGRVITLCKEWMIREKNGKGNISIGYENFRKWALQNGYSDNLTIDRIDVNKGYSPDNCRWVTMKEQQNNRRNNRLITYNGKTQTMKQWAEELGISYEILESRLNKRHWTVEKAFEKKEYFRFIMIEYKGRTQNLTEWCKELDLNFDKIKWR